MRKTNVAMIVKENVQELLRHHDKVPADGVGIQALRRRAGLSMGSAQRVLGATDAEHTSLGLDLVEKIALSFGLRPYQLLVPGLDPAAPARLPETEEERRIARAITLALQAARTMKHEDEERERPVGGGHHGRPAGGEAAGRDQKGPADHRRKR